MGRIDIRLLIIWSVEGALQIRGAEDDPKEMEDQLEGGY